MRKTEKLLTTMKLLFLDESGDHNLDPRKVDASYPIFVLAGCIFDQDYYLKKAVLHFEKLKETFFSGTDIIFHAAEMIRPIKSKEKRFLKLINAAFRKEFYLALNKVLGDTEFTLVACVIKKGAHLEKYGLEAMDPYLLSFDNLLNRFMLHIGNSEQGTIVAEKRNSVLDNQLELAWLNAKISGTKFFSGSQIKEKIQALQMLPKSKNEIGLQVADLLASPIGRNFLSIKNKPGNEVDFSLIKGKLAKDNHATPDNGITILPN